MPLKLTYFGLPGLGEITRLILTVGNVPFEDHRLTTQEWLTVKPSTPFGQLPVLQLEDGSNLAQSFAIEQYAAHLAGLGSSDPLKEARVNEASLLFNEIIEVIRPTAQLPSDEEKLRARAALLAGPLPLKLAIVEKFVADKTSATGSFLFGDSITRADITLFHWTSFVPSGFFTGIPADLFKDYPAISALRAKVASVPAIAAFYEKESDDLRKAYRA